MSHLLPLAPSPVEAPLPMGTRVALDERAAFIDRDLLSGGSPWRLLRLPGGSKVVAERWRGGGEVRAGEERFARTLVQQGLLHPICPSRPDVDLVDVVIPVLDEVAPLRALLAHLAGLHVTVVDDGSVNPDLIEECARDFDVTLLRLEENHGPAGARNSGALATSRPLLWFLDEDVLLDNPLDVLGRLQTQLDDPLVAAVAPRIRGGEGATARDRFEQSFSPLDMGARSGLAVPGGAVPYVPSACLLVRRSAFGTGFDDTMRVGEDVDLVWRLHDQGWLVRYDADVVVGHRARGTWRHWWNQRVGYGMSTSELARRHDTRVAPFRGDPWTLLAWATVLVGKPMIGLRVVRGAQDHLRKRLFATTDEPDRVSVEVVGRGMVGSGGPLARAVVRTFGLVVLAASLHPKLRRRALLLFAAGTAWRWRSTRVQPADLALGVADDLAYGVGVYRGAWRSRTLGGLKPHVTKSTMGLRDFLGLDAPSTEA